MITNSSTITDITAATNINEDDWEHLHTDKMEAPRLGCVAIFYL